MTISGREEDRTRVAAIVTTADPETLLTMARSCRDATQAGASVRVFFRDESIPAICRPEEARNLKFEPDRAVHAMLRELSARPDTRLYACSSSLYVWGISAENLLPALNGPRGLIAFLVEDLAGADEILSY